MAFTNRSINPIRRPKTQTTRAHEEDFINPGGSYKQNPNTNKSISYGAIGNVYNTINGNYGTAKQQQTTISKPATVSKAAPTAGQIPQTEINPTPVTEPDNTITVGNNNIPGSNNVGGANINADTDINDEDIDLYINDILGDENEINNNTNNGGANGGTNSNTGNNGISSGTDIYNQASEMVDETLGKYQNNNPYASVEANAISALAEILANKGYSQQEINQMMSGINQNILGAIQPELQKAEAESYARGIGQSSVLNRMQSDIYGKAAQQIAKEQSNIIQQGKELFSKAIDQIQLGSVQKEKLNQEWAALDMETKQKLAEFMHQVEVDAQNNKLNWAQLELETKKFQAELKEKGLNTLGNFLGFLINVGISIATML